MNATIDSRDVTGSPDSTFGGPHVPVKDSLERDLLQLRAWPPLTRMGTSNDIECMARVCALLSRKPTVGFLIHRVLELPHRRVHDALQILHASGCVGPARKAQVGVEVTEEPVAETAAASVPQESFLSRLWRRLALR